MTKPHAIGTLDEIRAIRDADNAERGLPAKGTHYGRGPHVPMTDDPESPGWTRQQYPIERHPQREEYCYPVDEEGGWVDRLIARLPAQAAARVLARVRPLGADWDGRAEVRVPLK